MKIQNDENFNMRRFLLVLVCLGYGLSVSGCFDMGGVGRKYPSSPHPQPVTETNLPPVSN